MEEEKYTLIKNGPYAKVYESKTKYKKPKIIVIILRSMIIQLQL